MCSTIIKWNTAQQLHAYEFQFQIPINIIEGNF